MAGEKCRLVFQDVPVPKEAFGFSAYWGDIFDQPAFWIVNFVRGGLILAIAFQAGIFKAKDNKAEDQWLPGIITGDRPHQTTRLLCGHALLGGAEFRGLVLGFFKDKFSAVAPEYGLDINLLVEVCLAAEERQWKLTIVYGAVCLGSVIILYFSPALGIFVFVIASAAAHYIYWQRGRKLASLFRGTVFDLGNAREMFSRKTPFEVSQALPVREQNLVLYRGFVPFVGSGIDLDGWSFVIPTDKPASSNELVRNFSTAEIYSAIKSHMTDLRLPSLECEEVVFARGVDVRDNKHILPDLGWRPNQTWHDDPAEMLTHGNSADLRRYLRIQFQGWGGELITTIYLRCSLHAQNLVVELRRFLLTPVAHKYRDIDLIPWSSKIEPFRQAVVSLLVGPIMAALAPVVIAGTAQEKVGEAFSRPDKDRQRRRRAVELDAAFDFGAVTSLRQQLSQTQFLHYYQKIDSEYVTKLIERRALESIETFLDDHGVDTQEFRDRQTTILNSGILVQGGNVNAESLAVGQGATASKAEHGATRKEEEK